MKVSHIQSLIHKPKIWTKRKYSWSYWQVVQVNQIKKMFLTKELQD
jgi:hypothetical protein